MFVVLITVLPTRFYRTNTDSTLSNGQKHVPQLNHHHILHHYYLFTWIFSTMDLLLIHPALDTLLELLAEAVRDINDGMHLFELLAHCIWLAPKVGETKLTCGDPELDRQIIPINLFLLFVAAAVVVLTAYAVEAFVFGHWDRCEGWWRIDRVFSFFLARWHLAWLAMWSIVSLVSQNIMVTLSYWVTKLIQSLLPVEATNWFCTLAIAPFCFRVMAFVASTWFQKYPRINQTSPVSSTRWSGLRAMHMCLARPDISN